MRLLAVEVFAKGAVLPAVELGQPQVAVVDQGGSQAPGAARPHPDVLPSRKPPKAVSGAFGVLRSGAVQGAYGDWQGPSAAPTYAKLTAEKRQQLADLGLDWAVA